MKFESKFNNKNGDVFEITIINGEAPLEADYWGFIIQAKLIQVRTFTFKVLLMKESFPEIENAFEFINGNEMIEELHFRLDLMDENQEIPFLCSKRSIEWLFI